MAREGVWDNRFRYVNELSVWVLIFELKGNLRIIKLVVIQLLGGTR